MKKRVIGKNEDGSPHILYTPEGMSIQLFDELWTLKEEKSLKYPFSLKLGRTVSHIEDARYFTAFLYGLQAGFEMNQVF